ncbi:MAG: D-2-hydroxyacid dehydrogenase [Treponema sp.]|nr:D-2-hydroxyacid dehydrogenase [Treponema sp.]
MTIAVLDGHALNPGDLSWEPLEKLGSLTVYPRTAPDAVVPRISGNDAILLNKIPITEEVLRSCPRLRYIGVQATGYNVIDTDACRRRGITVTNVPAYSTAGVAQLVFAFLGEAACRTQLHSDSVMDGDWCRSPDFCYWKRPLTELEGKTLGIFGYGSIGRRVARIATAYGMHVIVCTRTPKPDIPSPVSFETLLQRSDIITLHAPLTPQTREIINAKTLGGIKKGAWLINTARGALVHEADVCAALADGTLSFYAADVVSEEPMRPDNPLLAAPRERILLTPHIAWASVETRRRLLSVVAQNLKSWMEGVPQNVIV